MERKVNNKGTRTAQAVRLQGQLVPRLQGLWKRKKTTVRFRAYWCALPIMKGRSAMIISYVLLQMLPENRSPALWFPHLPLSIGIFYIHCLTCTQKTQEE